MQDLARPVVSVYKVRILHVQTVTRFFLYGTVSLVSVEKHYQARTKVSWYFLRITTDHVCSSRAEHEVGPGPSVLLKFGLMTTAAYTTLWLCNAKLFQRRRQQQAAPFQLQQRWARAASGARPTPALEAAVPRDAPALGPLPLRAPSPSTRGGKTRGHAGGSVCQIQVLPCSASGTLRVLWGGGVCSCYAY